MLKLSTGVDTLSSEAQELFGGTGDLVTTPAIGIWETVLLFACLAFPCRSNKMMVTLALHREAFLPFGIWKVPNRTIMTQIELWHIYLVCSTHFLIIELVENEGQKWLTCKEVGIGQVWTTE